MLDLSPNMSVLTLAANGLNMPIKRQNPTQLQKQLSTKTHFKHSIGRLKVLIKQQKKDISCKHEFKEQG